tara:strand:+ start:236 stop:493 length:258 start_codon:yes stop_codon:yes gene_type:complete
MLAQISEACKNFLGTKVSLRRKFTLTLQQAAYLKRLKMHTREHTSYLSSKTTPYCPYGSLSPITYGKLSEDVLNMLFHGFHAYRE